jgi:hypothetical protein
LNGFKVALQSFADETGLTLRVSHFPPGTSKWNKIEHQMFSAISLNWRGRPLTTLEMVVNLIGHTRTKGGLRIEADLDRGAYPTGQKPDREAIDALQIERPEGQNAFWNYTIRPHVKPATEDIVC